MPLKTYLQCVRNTQCFASNPTDANMIACSKTEDVQKECMTFHTAYSHCKIELMDMTSRFRGNKALR
jgi:putative aminopeptidase FrvX